MFVKSQVQNQARDNEFCPEKKHLSKHYWSLGFQLIALTEETVKRLNLFGLKTPCTVKKQNLASHMGKKYPICEKMLFWISFLLL